MKYYYIYVLQSDRNKNFYVGFTKNLNRRTKQHVEGMVQSTKNRRPLKLVYWEGCLNQDDSTRIEKYLKSAWGNRYIKNLFEKLSHGVKALCAILFLYKEVLKIEIGKLDELIWAKTPRHLPVVLTRAEVKAMLSHLNGNHWLMANLLYGSGLPLKQRKTTVGIAL